MENSLLWADQLRQRFAGKILSERESAPGELEFRVERSVAKEFVAAAKNLESGGFDHLADLTAYDEFPSSPRYFVVYELISMLRKQRCSVIVSLEDSEPRIDSVCELWAGANWLEREVFDLYGIQFSEHPDLRRILLPEAFKGHPLRKDFVVDYRQEFPESVSDEGIFDPYGNTIVETSRQKDEL